MNSLDRRIEKKRRTLNKAVKSVGVMHKLTIKLSQQLDGLIIKRLRHSYSSLKGSVQAG